MQLNARPDGVIDRRSASDHDGQPGWLVRSQHRREGSQGSAQQDETGDPGERRHRGEVMHRGLTVKNAAVIRWDQAPKSELPAGG